MRGLTFLWGEFLWHFWKEYPVSELFNSQRQGTMQLYWISADLWHSHLWPNHSCSCVQCCSCEIRNDILVYYLDSTIQLNQTISILWTIIVWIKTPSLYWCCKKVENLDFMMQKWCLRGLVFFSFLFDCSESEEHHLRYERSVHHHPRHPLSLPKDASHSWGPLCCCYECILPIPVRGTLKGIQMAVIYTAAVMLCGCMGKLETHIFPDLRTWLFFTFPYELLAGERTTVHFDCNLFW